MTKDHKNNYCFSVDGENNGISSMKTGAKTYF